MKEKMLSEGSFFLPFRPILPIHPIKPIKTITPYN